MRSKKVPKQIPPKGVQRQYTAILGRLVTDSQRALRPLRDALPGLLRSAHAEIMDSGESDEVSRLIRTAARSVTIDTAAVRRVARQIAKGVERHQYRQFSRQIQSVLGTTAPLRDVRALSSAFTSENVALIKDLPAKMYGDIERIVHRGISSGTLHKDLASQIQGAIGSTRKRAKLIARDQVGKYYGQVSRARMRGIGLSKFRWMSVQDERVRSEHSYLHGQVFSWDTPPSEGIPGHPINCRCYPDPVFDL